MSTDTTPAEVQEVVNGAALAPPPSLEVPAGVPNMDSDDDDDDDKSSNSKPRLNPPEGGFTEFPKEWNSSEYAPVRKSDFADLTPYYQFKLEEAERLVSRYKEELELIRVYGSNEAGLKKARADQKTLTKAKELMESGDIPLDALMNLLGRGTLEQLLARAQAAPPQA